jgi:hypothetical protein
MLRRSNSGKQEDVSSAASGVIAFLRLSWPIWTVLANAPPLNTPQFAGYRTLLQALDESGLEHQWIAEVEIQRDKAALFSLAGGQHFCIGTAAKPFGASHLDIVPCRSKDLRDPVAQILIQFQLHGTVSSGMST